MVELGKPFGGQWIFWIVPKLRDEWYQVKMIKVKGACRAEGGLYNHKKEK